MAPRTRRPKKHYLVIGIDFGTTYTGVSYSWSAAYQDDSDIISITDWPALGSQVEHAAKVPTQISYEADETGTSTNCWGYLIRPGVPRCVWMKLLLDKNARVTMDDDPNLREALQRLEEQLPPGKSVQEITVDFFRELYEFTMQSLRKDYPDMLIDVTPIKYWFTMPAIWSDEAQIRTLQAAEKGGFGARRSDEVSVIPEPEAAALATLTNAWPSYGDEIGVDEKGILVCDCGGGTVDLTTYSVVNDDPWELEECNIGNGGKCGAINLDQNLHRLLSSRFGQKFEFLAPALTGPGSQMMQDFEWNKRIFGEPCASLKQLRLFMDEDDSQYYDRFDGAIILKDADMKEIFDPVVDRIISLVARQVKSAPKNGGSKITYVLLVGGLGSSPYLQDRLREWCVDHRIRMGGPKYSWGAVVKGAVVRGLELATVTRKKCRRHYGVVCARPYEPLIHGNRPGIYRCPFNGWDMVPNCMSWSIKRGIIIEPDAFTPIEFYVVLSDTERTLEIELKSCSLPDAPDWYDENEVEGMGKIVADFSGVDFSQFSTKIIDGIAKYKVEYALEVVLGHRQGTVGFRVRIGNEVVGQTSVVFEEPSPRRAIRAEETEN